MGTSELYEPQMMHLVSGARLEETEEATVKKKKQKEDDSGFDDVITSTNLKISSAPLYQDSLQNAIYSFVIFLNTLLTPGVSQLFPVHSYHCYQCDRTQGCKLSLHLLPECKMSTWSDALAPFP